MSQSKRDFVKYLPSKEIFIIPDVMYVNNIYIYINEWKLLKWKRGVVQKVLTLLFVDFFQPRF